MDRFFSFVECFAERRLTKRKAKRAYERSKKRTVVSEILDWLDALVFGVVVVFLINQYIFQLFLIPSPSMVDTLLVKDRVVVSKMSYGIEPYPAAERFFRGNRRVERDSIITFYNPEYDSKGPVFDALSQITYMATLSLVNIDRNDDGTPAERLFVKRAVGMGGDTVRFEDGNVKIKVAGSSEFVPEEEFREGNGLSTGPNRTLDPDLYDGIKAHGRLWSMQEEGIKSYPEHLINSYEAIKDYKYLPDAYAFERERSLMGSLIDPSDAEKRSKAKKYEAGIYVPSGCVLPLGDNRDNSRDGRYFGPVDEGRVNGRVVARFWPLGRIGSLTDK